MSYCSRCLYPEKHPLNLILDDEGICSGCRVHEEKDIIDWNKTSNELKTLLNAYKNTSGNNYDCIIPVSGARDSFFIVHTIKNVYGMNPLLVTYNKQFNTPEGVRNLANLRIHFNCDIFTLTVNPQIVKKITRSTFRQFGSIYWHCLAGQTVYPVQIAVKFKIPLIIWGAHQGIDQVGMFSHLDKVEMTRKYRKEHDLMGYEAEDLVNDFDDICFKDVAPFIYPDDKEIEQVGVRGIYLNNYLRWDSKQQHEEMLKIYAYESKTLNRTFDTYNDVDCYNYSDVHDYIKYVKHGYGKSTDHACREIRLRKISRKQGLRLVQKYIHKKPKNLQLFLDWLGITENSFNYILDQHRNKAYWTRNENWEWVYSNENLIKLQKAGLNKNKLPLVKNNSSFLKTEPNLSTDHKNKYILIGKGK